MNLLTDTEKENLKKGLNTRFAIISLFLISLSFLIGVIMLVPSYLLTKEHLSIAGVSKSPEADENLSREIANLPAEINPKLEIFRSHLKDFGTVDTISKIIMFLPESVTINSLSLSRDQNQKEMKGVSVLISGIANDRDSLVSFSSSLKGSGYFSSVEIPVSNLTKEKNVPFSINIFIDQK